MKIDIKDKRILGELLDNCRQSNKEIGKKVNLSREAVASRIRRLEKEGIIRSYITETNFARIGFTSYAILLKISGGISKIEKLIQQNREIISFQKSLGKYNILLSIKAKNPFELNNQIKKIRQTLIDQIQDFQIVISIKNYDFQSSFFKEPLLTTTIKDVSNSIMLSETENNILKELSQNSKISLVELATKTNLSAVTVAQKIKQLKSKDILKIFRILIDYKKLELNRYSLALNIKSIQEEKFIEFCKKHKQIIDVSELLGKFNFTTEILAKDNETFRQVVDQIIKKFEVKDYEYLILLEEIKKS